MRPDGILSLETATRRFLSSLDQPSRILVAISGGSDSTGLLIALSDALKAEPASAISLCAATVDHALRPQSADEARDVAALCRSLDIPHATKVWRGAKPKAGIMAAARDARYALLADAAAEFGADIIVTGHTLDDQRETFAMRGQRSALNMTGIADAVLFDHRIWIARPLLSSLRADIRAMLELRGIGWSDDPSNEDTRYERVRTRQALAGEGISVAEIEAMTASRMALDEAAAGWVDAHVDVHEGMLVQVGVAGLSGDRAVLGHGLARLAAVIGGQAFALGAEQIGAVLDFLAAGRLGRMTAGRVVFDLRRDGLYLARETRGLLPLTVGAGERGVWDGRYLAVNGSGVEVRVVAANAPHSLIPVPKDLGTLDSCDIARAKLGHRNEGGEGRGAEATLPLENLPRSTLARAAAAQPRILAADPSPDLAGKIEIVPYFALYDRFLTRLDVKFAASLAAAFGTRPYPKPPLGLIDGKTI
ncbi:tRNA lysidine(34) synthetase TilS [Rhizobium metallidurans]|uniref:tRNA(Ile)-lysidine synthase n=1 Tax=Rhizobium metallidurans TaxID=1265931 RepID=A0A7W6CPM2_9HYPH|nr:tRNA lysidine(34) synthetase TilS [Rhizobium metallidurans]MBB3964888.1 tRNA(Ile)-lysidine synthase [Rhizobium metallidurans]